MLLLVFGSLLAAFLVYGTFTIGRRGGHLPDGPPTLPFIGNLHQMPQKRAFLQFERWAKQYGGMFSLKVGPATFIVLSDRRIAKQVLDKRSAISSDRMVSEVSQQIVTEGDHLLWMDATPEWRLMRRLIHGDLTEAMCDQHHGKIQHAEGIQMLHDMMHAPESWKRRISRYSNSVIMSIIYGIRNPSIDDKWMERLETLLDNWARINALGATPPIDIIPILRWIPQSLLGNWRTRAMAVHDELHALYNGLLQSVMERRKIEGSQHSVLDRLLDNQTKSGLTDHQITLLSGVTIKGGSDTSASVLAAFVQAMVTWPDVQKAAQAEIDSVVSEDRIPDFSDYKKLPYVATVIKETQRWRGISGLGMPRRLSEDEWVDGKLLPKSSVLFVNVWALHHDDKRFPNPEIFDPDRYKGKYGVASEYANHPDPEQRDHYSYGFGRRICPGMQLAERNLFHVVAKMLWAFDLEMQIDPVSGEPIVPDVSIETGYREGLTYAPEPFPVKLTVRSEARRAAIEEGLACARVDVFEKYEKTNLINA